MNLKTIGTIILTVMIGILVAWFTVSALNEGVAAAYRMRVDKCMQSERFTEKDCEYIAGVLWDSMLW